MKYRIVLQHTDEGVTASVPGLPGCWSEGDTEDEAVANISEAIQDYLAAIEQETIDADCREIEVVV